jgi:heme oxygenase
MSKYDQSIITESFLNSHSNAYFVFGDNLERRGTGGAAKLRYHARAIGFITKKFPDNRDESFYKPEEYSSVFFEELDKLEKVIKNSPNNIFYISQLGAGLANKYRIWEKLIQHNVVRRLENFNNVIFCWQ